MTKKVSSKPLTLVRADLLQLANATDVRIVNYSELTDYLKDNKVYNRFLHAANWFLGKSGDINISVPSTNSSVRLTLTDANAVNYPTFTGLVKAGSRQFGLTGKYVELQLPNNTSTTLDNYYDFCLHAKMYERETCEPVGKLAVYRAIDGVDNIAVVPTVVKEIALGIYDAIDETIAQHKIADDI